jgi:branched-chain amino acid transport system substrate-binding protein
MKFAKLAAIAVAATFLPFASAHYKSAMAQTIKIGFITSFTGQNASVGVMMDKAVKLWMKEHEKDLPAGVKVEILNRDDTGPNPEVAKRLATELVTRDKVDFLAGVIWTPNAAAIAPIAAEAKTPFVIMNAGTSGIIPPQGAPYTVRVSFTLWQSSLPLGQWAAKNNIKKVYSLVSDFGPGIDAETAFKQGFTDGGGTIAEAVRMPLATQDFAPFMQKAKDAKPDAVFVFIPAGVQATGVMKAYSDLGLAKDGIKLIGPGDITTDEELPNMGDVALGAITMFHYSAAAKRPANEAFVKMWQRDYGANDWPAFEAAATWDGMMAIFDTIKAQNGKVNGEKSFSLLKGWKTDASPRGPIQIDPQTGDIIQNEYLRRVEKVNGVLGNVEVETFATAVKDPWKLLKK